MHLLFNFIQHTVLGLIWPHTSLRAIALPIFWLLSLWCRSLGSILGLVLVEVDRWLRFILGCSTATLEDSFFLDDLVGKRAACFLGREHFSDFLL